jgi:hypothetical protein
MAKIVYNGVSMDEAWVGRIKASQDQPDYTAEGVKYARIRYGDEDPRWGETPCRNCGVVKGQFHVTAECEFEKCPKCGESIGGHICRFDEYGPDERRRPRTGRFTLSPDARWAIFFVLLLGLLASLSALGVFDR